MSFIALARLTSSWSPLSRNLQRVRRRHHARDALRAAGAGKQADLDFRQAEPRLVVVGGDAVMAGERKARSRRPARCR